MDQLAPTLLIVSVLFGCNGPLEQPPPPTAPPIAISVQTYLAQVERSQGLAVTEEAALALAETFARHAATDVRYVLPVRTGPASPAERELVATLKAYPQVARRLDLTSMPWVALQVQ